MPRSTRRVLVPLVLFVCVPQLAAPALAQPYEWIGAGPGVWSDASKWSLGSPPGFNNLAIISDGSQVLLDVITPQLGHTRLGDLAPDSGSLVVAAR